MNDTRDTFERNRRTALSSAQIQIDFVLANLQHLRKVDKNQRMETAVLNFEDILKGGDMLTPGQFSYLDGIFEKTWKGANYESVNVHADKKRKGLRYG
jgi:hypothetical protein